MIRPNFVGSPWMYLNPSADYFSTAELAAIDTAFDPAVVSPYAYTATVADDKDAFNFNMAAAGSVLVAGMRVAFGLFLSPENEKKNLMWQVTGKAKLYGSGTGLATHGSFFFGRKATNNTVVSSKASANNTLASYMLLPSKSVQMPNFPTTSGTTTVIVDSIQSNGFSLYLDAGYVYCFGYLLDNVTANNATLYGGINLSFRKYQSEIGVFRPSR